MLKKAYRLPIQGVVGKSGRIIKTPCFLVKIFSNELRYPRFGIVISKKISAKATKRNEIRRMLFSMIEKDFFPPNDFLIIVSPKINESGKEEIMIQLKKALKA